MAYLRDDCYIFDSGEHFHIWVRGGYDSWRESGWAEMTKQPDLDSGVRIPTSSMDRFVLMRFAEMLVEGSADALLKEMASEGNTGAVQLLGNLEVIRSAVRDLQDRVRKASVDDLWGGASN